MNQFVRHGGRGAQAEVARRLNITPAAVNLALKQEQDITLRLSEKGVVTSAYKTAPWPPKKS